MIFPKDNRNSTHCWIIYINNIMLQQLLYNCMIILMYPTI